MVHAVDDIAVDGFEVVFAPAPVSSWDGNRFSASVSTAGTASHSAATAPIGSVSFVPFYVSNFD